MTYTKCTPERIEKIGAAVAAGAYANQAAAMNNIGERTYWDWMRRGQDGEEPYATFRERMREAEAQAEVANIAIVRTAAQEGTWQAAAWYLERKHPERWGRRDRVTAEMTARVSVADPKDVVLSALAQIKNGDDGDTETADGGDEPR